MIKRTFRSILTTIFTKWYGRRLGGGKKFLKVNWFCKFGCKTFVGENCHFNGAKLYGNGQVHIGNNFHSGSGLIILTQNHNYNGLAIPYDSTVIIKNVIIGDNVWVGMNVMILPGVDIGEGAIVQAGAVVSSNIKPLSIVGGNPARIIRFRDSDHYQKLKADGRFH